MAFALKSSLFTGFVAFCVMAPPVFAEEQQVYKVALINNAGEQTGTVDLEETTKGVLMTLDIYGLGKAGERAIHIHETAACSPIKTFKNAGGHYNPNEEAHGLHHENGTHAGDMPNLIVREDGTVKVKILNTFVTLDEEEKDGRAPLFDEDGSALMIHAGADDYKSQPSGAAGARVACGVITNQVEAVLPIE
jgi:Cu-Zn family superoxide dismutase